MDATGSAVACAEVVAPLLSLTNVAGGDMQAEDDLGDLGGTQVLELGRTRFTEDSVAKDMVMRCAEDAASRATSEMKAVTSQLLQDAAERDQRLAERDAALAERTRPERINSLVWCEGSLRISRQQNQQSLTIRGQQN